MCYLGKVIVTYFGTFKQQSNPVVVYIGGAMVSATVHKFVLLAMPKVGGKKEIGNYA